MQYEVEVSGRLRQVNVHRVDDRFVVSLDGVDWLVDAARVDSHTLSLLTAGTEGGAIGSADGRTADLASALGERIASHEVTLTPDAASGRTAITVGAVPLMVTLNGRRRSRGDAGMRAAGGPQRLLAPMPGKVLRLLVALGQSVTERQAVVVVEAMKMENEIRAAAAGVVAELHVSEGQSVDAGTLLAVLGPV